MSQPDSSVLVRLTRPALASLADALESERLKPPYTVSALAALAPAGLADELGQWLAARDAEGLLARHAAMLLRLLAEERRSTQEASDRAQLVWSGIELPGSTARDTSVVVQELFRAAHSSVLVASYALDHGSRAAALFGTLAHRMELEAQLSVRFFVNIQRQFGDETPAPDLVRAFSRRFREEIWPGGRYPEVYYDPRSLGPSSTEARACLHAKCIVIDSESAFITSANFTEAAQSRNLEAGVLLRDGSVPKIMDYAACLPKDQKFSG